MRGLHAAGVAVLLLLALVSQSSRGWGGAGAPQEQPKSSHFVHRRTYVPQEFYQSHLDSLSGGVAKGLPYRMAVDSKGRILVTDPVLSVVHVFDIEERKFWQVKGDRGHPLDSPAYIAVDADDNIYITETRRSRIVVLQPEGHFLRTIGIGLLQMPTGIVVDSQHRRIYVTDWLRGDILSFDLEGKLLQVLGRWGTRPGELVHPVDLVLHGGTLVVLDSGKSRFELFDLQGASRGSLKFEANRSPITFAVDTGGNLHYIDANSGGLVAMNPQGEVLAEFGPRRFGQWIPRSGRHPIFSMLSFRRTGQSSGTASDTRYRNTRTRFRCGQIGSLRY